MRIYTCAGYNIIAASSSDFHKGGQWVRIPQRAACTSGTAPGFRANGRCVAECPQYNKGPVADPARRARNTRTGVVVTIANTPHAQLC